MDDSKKLIEFIENSTDRLDLRVSEFTWMKGLGIPLADVAVSISTKPWGKLVGRGTSGSFHMALVKAFVEASERELIRERRWLSTNGVAGHTNLSEAMARAERELLERHIFLDYFLSGRRFRCRQIESSTDTGWKLLEYCNKQRVNHWCSTIEVPTKGTFALVILYGLNRPRPFGLIVGCALEESRDAAIEKALIEASRFLAFFEDTRSYSSISETQFRDIGSPTFEDHGRLGLDLEYGNWFLENYIENDGDAHSEFSPIRDVNFEIVDQRQSGTKAPIAFARATSQFAHVLSCGSSDTTKPHPFR